jgi:glycosyltransferase involved in cell wall biosynthesis
MKSIVIVNQSAGYLMTDIVNAHVNTYDEVVLVVGSIKRNERQLDSRVKIEKICEYDRSSAIKRLATWCKGTYQIYRLLKRKYAASEVVYVTNPPSSYLCSLRLKNVFSIIVFDTYPDALSNIGIGRANPFFKMWSKWNRKLFAEAKTIFTLSNGMADRMSQYVSREKISVIPCWSANSQFKPVPKDKNPFIAKHHLQDKFIVMYSGNMGVTHNVEVLIDCARRVKINKQIHFMLIGSGAKRAELENAIANDHLENCTILDWLPADELPFSLAAADLGVVSLNDQTALVSVPSKTFNLLAVGAPLLCIVPPKSEIAQMVDKYHNGEHYGANDVDAIVTCISNLSSDYRLQQYYSQNSLNAAKDFTFENAKMYVR